MREMGKIKAKEAKAVKEGLFSVENWRIITDYGSAMLKNQAVTRCLRYLKVSQDWIKGHLRSQQMKETKKKNN